MFGSFELCKEDEHARWKQKYDGEKLRCFHTRKLGLMLFRTKISKDGRANTGGPYILRHFITRTTDQVARAPNLSVRKSSAARFVLCLMDCLNGNSLQVFVEPKHNTDSKCAKMFRKRGMPSVFRCGYIY